jgi:hypothetical protein
MLLAANKINKQIDVGILINCKQAMRSMIYLFIYLEMKTTE